MFELCLSLSVNDVTIWLEQRYVNMCEKKVLVFRKAKFNLSSSELLKKGINFPVV